METPIFGRTHLFKTIQPTTIPKSNNMSSMIPPDIMNLGPLKAITTEHWNYFSELKLISSGDFIKSLSQPGLISVVEAFFSWPDSAFRNRRMVS